MQSVCGSTTSGTRSSTSTYRRTRRLVVCHFSIIAQFSTYMRVLESPNRVCFQGQDAAHPPHPSLQFKSEKETIRISRVARLATCTPDEIGSG
jgi:hypothetical protein